MKDDIPQHFIDITNALSDYCKDLTYEGYGQDVIVCSMLYVAGQLMPEIGQAVKESQTIGEFYPPIMFGYADAVRKKIDMKLN
ncbi:MAG: hypothetical protein EBR82_11945 [Caulobacteraceae bacterium]|nr:hypothetical protein [Caulobacteraceae bacterium]